MKKPFLILVTASLAVILSLSLLFMGTQPSSKSQGSLLLG